MRHFSTLRALGAARAVTRLAVVASVLAWSPEGLAQRASSPPSSPTVSTKGTERGASEWTQWTSGRYRLTPGDVIQLTFPYVSEFDQTVTILPDGYVSLRGVRDVYAQGLTLPQFEQSLIEAYTHVLRDPFVSLSLKEFEKPYFIAAGEVAHPGKFDLRGATTVTQALAIAGGTTKAAKSSQIILFRRFTDELLEVKTINAKKMLRSRDLSEDAVLRPGDTLFVPTTVLSQIGNLITKPALGLYLDPLRLVP